MNAGGIKATRLRQLRFDADLTQEALAQKAGVALRTLIRVEQGETSPQTETAFRLARALKVSVIDLFDTEVVA